MSVDRKVPVEEYAMLRTLESLTGSMMRMEYKSLRQLQGSWIWFALLEQVKGLARFRAESTLSGRKGEES